MKHIVAIYEVDRAYGGPEEGGWWFDTGDHQRTVAVRSSSDEAYAVARRVNRLLAYRESLYGYRSSSSMAYDGGEYRARVYRGSAPRHYPESRPYYE